MQTLLSRADIIARDAAGGLVVVVEVKNREGLTPEIATQLHRNMVAHGLVGRVPYFLLLSQDVGYLWLEKPDSPIDAPATLRFPMQRVVERYSAGVLDRKRLREHELQLLVLHWLSELSVGWPSQRGDMEEPERSLAEAGLLDALRDATIEPNALV